MEILPSILLLPHLKLTNVWAFRLPYTNHPMTCVKSLGRVGFVFQLLDAS